MKLALAELCEGLVPLGYAISFAMAYYGPNAELLGFCKDYHWHVKVYEDATRTFLIMIALFLIDIVCLALNSSILWISCKVNLFKESCFVIQKYWYILALKMVNELWWNFYHKDVNLANFNLGKSSLPENYKNFSLTSNSTDT